MKLLLIFISVSLAAIFAACDVRSDIAKKNMEKYVSTPTPLISPTPAGTPIDPADIVEVDVGREGRTIFVDGDKQNKSAACTKFDRIMVNGNGSLITLKGACQQIMINGDQNTIMADAGLEYVFNGTNNTVKYLRFVNGKQPIVTENKAGNVAEKISAKAATGDKSPRKIVK